MSADKIGSLRAQMAAHGLDGFLVPRADEHLGEYVPESAERLRWLTGFTGSAGLAIVLARSAAVFTDGRYTLQLSQQSDPDVWQLRHITDEPPPAWLVAHAPAGARIGYDPMLHSEDALKRFVDAGLAMQPATPNPLDAVWQDRPAPPAAPVVVHANAGRSSVEKRETLGAELRAAGVDAAVLTDPASIAWLLNIRGGDVDFTPFALGFALLHADARCELFMAPEKLSAEARIWLGNAVTAQDRATLPAALDRLAGRRVQVDPAASPAWFAQRLRAAGAEVVAGADPCALPKASKNVTEQQGARDAHRRDAVALCRFLHWLDHRPAGTTEMSAAARLVAFRAESPMFRGESFPAISGAGEHGAIIHYRVTPESDRALGDDETYLIDSGAQYIDGTTDVTRTIWTGPGTPPAALRDRFTRVLQGHIAIARLVFPQGVAGPHLDAFARAALWRVGLDYDHGTGHGVGSYLSVHEGPASLSRAARPVPLAEGMVMSDEPGFYAPGEYGIRLENLLLVQKAGFAAAAKPFLQFETLTLAPFDRRLLEPSLLTSAERDWLNSYHIRVWDTVGVELSGVATDWLAEACATVG